MKVLAVSESHFLSLTSDIEDVDENSCIIHFFETNTIEKTVKQVVLNNEKFYRPIIQLPNSVHEIVLSRVNKFNLLEASSSKCNFIDDLKIADTSDFFVPHYARSATLAFLSTYQKIEQSLIDECLKNYFTSTRYLCSEDLISIDTTKYIPEIFTHGIYPKKLYFKVKSIDGPSYYVDIVTCGYYVDTEHTTVHQVPSVRSCIPRYEMQHFIDSENLDHSTIPDGLNDIAVKIEQIMLPFLHSDKLRKKLPSVFLLTGRSGAGKTTLLSSIAAKHGVRYIHENCLSIQNSNAIQTEKAISNILVKISTLTPCLLHFRNIETLCRDESGNIDDRTVDHFIKQIKLNTSNFPLIVFCTTSSQAQLSPPLQRIFLQKLHMGLPNFDCRCSLLRWILKRMRIKFDELRIEEIARTTSNFVFADLVQLICRALQINFQERGIQNRCDLYYEIDINCVDQALKEMASTFADSVGAPEIPNVTWDDVGGLTELKEEILSSLLTPTSSTLRRSGILLYGPPGTGKTLLAKAIATECKYNFLSVKGPELLNMYVGQSEKNVREVFARARECAPCIVFFDELDSLAPKRGQSGGSGSVMDRVVSQLLAEMDSIEKKSDIFILAATNRYDLIDSALLRPGRLDKMLFVGGCKDFESKLNILKALTRKFQVSSNVDFEQLIKQIPESQDVTGADLYGVCSQAWLNAARRTIESSEQTELTGDNNVCVSPEDFISAFLHFKYSNTSLLE